VEFRLDEGTAAVAPGVRVERDEDVLVIALAGEHDVSTRDSVWAPIDRALDARLAIVIDLRGAEFVDSVIAAIFLEARKKAKRENLGLGIVLADARENAVRRMFELSQLTRVFAVYASAAEAVVAVREGFSEP
jgi:anti-anti-sigma factor